jgi:hypothetical protein
MRFTSRVGAAGSRWPGGCSNHNGDPNWRGFAGATCLAWAELDGSSVLCALLRERGASDLLVDSTYSAVPRLFPLYVLAGWGFPPDRLAARLDADPSLVLTTSEYGSLLHAAAEGGQTASVELLLERGADRHARNAIGQTAADLAEAKGLGEIAKTINR